MPTPESAAFLAKKPTVPPSYEGVDFEDNVAVHNARDAIIREQWVRSMMSRLVGEELGKCYAREGVNHLEKCGALRGWFLFLSFLVCLLAFLLSRWGWVRVWVECLLRNCHWNGLFGPMDQLRRIGLGDSCEYGIYANIWNLQRSTLSC